MKFSKSRPASTPQYDRPPTRSSTFGSLEEQLSLLDIKSDSGARKRPATPPPPYSENPAPLETADPKASQTLKAQGTWETVTSTDTPTREADDAAFEANILEKATAFASPPSPGPESCLPRTFPRLARPIVIPRVNPGLEMPFTRAWVPSLEEHAIAPETFLAFIDNLNAVCTPHPAFKALEIASFGLQFVPLPYAEGLGGALYLVALTATLTVVHLRGKNYMERVNDVYFHPRGLHATTAGTKKMKRVLGIPKDHVLLAPLTEKTLGLSAQERCLAEAARCGAAELVTDDLPPPAPVAGAIAKLTAWRIRQQVNSANKSAVRGRKRAWKKHARGKKLKDGWVEKRRVKDLGWIVIRNLEDVEREREEKEKAMAAKKKRSRTSGRWSLRGEVGEKA